MFKILKKLLVVIFNKLYNYIDKDNNGISKADILDFALELQTEYLKVRSKLKGTQAKKLKLKD